MFTTKQYLVNRKLYALAAYPMGDLLASLRCARGAPLREAFLAARDHALIDHDEDLCC